jgi:hypothetical protein
MFLEDGRPHRKKMLAAHSGIDRFGKGENVCVRFSLEIGALGNRSIDDNQGWNCLG